MNNKTKSFKQLLIEKREQKGMLKKEVAELFNWTPMYYGRYENGNLKPSSSNIRMFSKFLDISEEELSIILEQEIVEKKGNKL